MDWLWRPPQAAAAAAAAVLLCAAALIKIPPQQFDPCPALAR
jgi:hypothetical protein